VSEGESSGCAGRSGTATASCPASVECKRSAGDVSLEVIIQAQFILPADLEGVLAADNGKRRSNVVLSVVVTDSAVPLRLANVAAEGEGGRGRSPHDSRCDVIAGRPTKICEVVTGKDGCTGVDKAAARDINVEDRVRGESMVQINGQQLGVVIFRAAVKTQTSSKWVGRQVKQPEVGEPSEESGRTRYVLVAPNHKFVGVSARTGGRGKVVDTTTTRRGGRRKILVPHDGGSLTEL